jgi:hypothetical protein
MGRHHHLHLLTNHKGAAAMVLSRPCLPQKALLIVANDFQVIKGVNI